MSIVRIAHRKKQWHTTDQRVLDDHRLSWAALGLHTFLCSRPDDWSVSVSYLGKTLMRLGRGAGRDKIYALLRELSDLGYADEKVERDGGKYKTHEWIIYDLPKEGFPLKDPEHQKSDLPDTALPDTAPPKPAKTALLNTDSSTNTDSNSRTESKSRARSARKSTPARDAGGHQAMQTLAEDPVLAGVAGAVVEAVRHGTGEIQDLRAFIVKSLKERDIAPSSNSIQLVLNEVRTRTAPRH